MFLEGQVLETTLRSSGRALFFGRAGAGALLSFLALQGCGGTVEGPSQEVVATGGFFVYTGGAASGGAQSGGSGGSLSETGGGEATGGEPPYIEPECPDEPPPEPDVECDPLGVPEEECGEDSACAPYLIYPNGAECGSPQFGALCVPAGTGQQGDFCEPDGCAAGFMCIVGAAGGKRCAEICQPVEDHSCPAGLICGETDVQGYGVCF